MPERVESYILPCTRIQDLLDGLVEAGYRTLGPTIEGRTLVYQEIRNGDDLPVGWTDEQDGGHYRLIRRRDKAVFGYVLGSHSWKRFLFPSRVRLWSARRNGDGFDFDGNGDPPPRYALLGVRPCELAAIRVQDRVFLDGTYVDPAYRARRAEALIIAVNCGRSGGTCFCASMGTGPRARAGYDLALTEILDAERHEFLVEVGSERGAAVVEPLDLATAPPEHERMAADVIVRAERSQRRSMETRGLRELLYRNAESPRWKDVADRCLTCANCTLVCPTCFCTSVEDVTDLTPDRAERWRRWDSCFTMEFSYIHGGCVRSSPMSRYRQWLTHKLASWHDQFETSGCVGCGRCITWCPVGIDLTVEVAAIRAGEASGVASGPEGDSQ